VVMCSRTVHIIYLLCLLCGCCLGATAPPTPCNQGACSGSAPCIQGICCNAVCIFANAAEEVGGGEACGDCTYCEAPYTCINGTCVVNSVGCSCPTNNYPDQSEGCSDIGYYVTCENFQCVELSLTGENCTSSSDCVLSDFGIPLYGCVGGLCQGMEAIGDSCNEDECQMNTYCSSETSTCQNKYTVAAGSACVDDWQCIGPLAYGNSQCINKLCYAPESVSDGSACVVGAHEGTQDFVCQPGSACLSGTCTSQIGVACSNDSTCGNKGTCSSCNSGSSVCEYQGLSAPDQCQTVLSAYQSFIANVAPNDDQFTPQFLLTNSEFINLLCCYDCTKNVPGFLGFAGLVSASSGVLTSLNDFNLNCDPSSFSVTIVGRGEQCCNYITEDTCGRDTSGCTQYLASGAFLTLAQKIGIGIGVGVAGLLIIGLIILCAYCCCCKKKKEED